MAAKSRNKSKQTNLDDLDKMRAPDGGFGWVVLLGAFVIKHFDI